MSQPPSEENKFKYKNWRKETHKILRREKKWYEDENNRNRRKQKNPKQFFENSNLIKEGFKSQVKMLFNEKGEWATNKREIVELFKKYFETLFNRQGKGSENENMTYYTGKSDIGKPKQKKVARIMETLNNNKSSSKN